MIEVIREYQYKPFEYGQDCCQFVRDCLRHRLGKDFGESFSYEDESGAQEILDSHGGLVGLMSSIFGEPKSTASNGDVVVCKMYNGREIAGIVYGDRIIVRTEKGVTDWPVQYASHSWEVK